MFGTAHFADQLAKDLKCDAFVRVVYTTPYGIAMWDGVTVDPYDSIHLFLSPYPQILVIRRDTNRKVRSTLEIPLNRVVMLRIDMHENGTATSACWLAEYRYRLKRMS